MPVEILMPALSPTMEEGKLARWLKNVGDPVMSGDVLAEIETDKATMEIEAVDEGRLGKILVAEGADNVPVNSVIALLLADGEALADDTAPGGKKNAPSASVPASSAPPSSRPFAPDAQISAPPVPAEPRPPEAASEPAPGPTQEMTVREALRDAIAAEMRRDETVFIMGEEVAEYEGAYKVTQGLLAEFGPRRVVDTPITEHGFAGLGVGAAMAGLRPVVEFMTFNFAMQALDQIVNSAAKTLYMSDGQMAAPIVFRGPNGAAARVAAQHSQDFAAWYAHIPGLKVIQPHNAADAKGLLRAAIRDPGPVVFLENEILYGRKFPVPVDPDYIVPIGKARIARAGNDVTLVSWGIGMNYALEAADELEKLGISAEIVDLRCLRPLDCETLFQSVRKTGRMVSVEEAFPVCSVSAELAFRVQAEIFDWLDAPVLRVTGKDVPMPYAANLEKLALPSVAEVIEAVRTVTYAG